MSEEDKDLKIALLLAKKGYHYSEYLKAEEELEKLRKDKTLNERI